MNPTKRFQTDSQQGHCLLQIREQVQLQVFIMPSTAHGHIRDRVMQTSCSARMLLSYSCLLCDLLEILLW